MPYKALGKKEVEHAIGWFLPVAYLIDLPMEAEVANWIIFASFQIQRDPDGLGHLRSLEFISYLVNRIIDHDFSAHPTLLMTLKTIKKVNL